MPENRAPRISIVDILIILLGLLFFITYDYEENLTPKGLLWAGTLLLFWFVLRIIYYYFPIIKVIFVWLLIFSGLAEAVWGLAQLYQLLPSGHSLFRVTGSFSNPGPYAGFMAVVLPLSLFYALSASKQQRFSAYFYWTVAGLCCLALPATMSRSAWAAAIGACCFVGLYASPYGKYFRTIIRRRNKRMIGLILAVPCIIILGYGGYHLKKDSADGRLFIWKITIRATEQTPVGGVGLGGFPGAYARAQMNYFEREKASETEQWIAGSPEYAFNEYLQIFLEQGWLGGLLFMFISGLAIRAGVRNKQTGATGAFIALSVFALASYPYRLVVFPLIWVVLATFCLSETKATGAWNADRKTLRSLLVLIVSGVGLMFLLWRQYKYYGAEQQWRAASDLRVSDTCAALLSRYAQLYHTLHYNPQFVFEYAQILHKRRHYETADKALVRGVKISGDPMFYNVLGRNYHAMKAYAKAEEALKKSLLLLPQRLYPYYLLTKLYADSACYQPQKMKATALMVLTQTPKVYTSAIREMRAEVRAIIASENGYEYE